MEPKTVQEMYDLSKTVTDEQRYYSTIRLLEQWNDKYVPQGTSDEERERCKMAVNMAKVQLDLEKQKKCFEKLEEIMDKMYGEIKGTALFKRIMENIKEGSKKYILAKESGQEEDIQQFNMCINGLYELAIEAKPEEIKSAASNFCVAEFCAADPGSRINMANLPEQLNSQVSISEDHRIVHTYFVQHKN